MLLYGIDCVMMEDLASGGTELTSPGYETNAMPTHSPTGLIIYKLKAHIASICDIDAAIPVCTASFQIPCILGR